MVSLNTSLHAPTCQLIKTINNYIIGTIGYVMPHIYSNCLEYSDSHERTAENEPHGESTEHQDPCYKKGCRGEHGSDERTDEEAQYPPVMSDLSEVVHGIRHVPRWHSVPVEIRQASPQEGDLFVVHVKLS
jgi:hypothetical protein